MSAIDHHRRAHAALTRAHDLTPDSSGTTTKGALRRSPFFLQRLSGTPLAPVR
jgi:hypothetical protein